MKDLIGKRVLLIWNDKAWSDGADWIAFRLLDFDLDHDENHWLWLQGIDSPDGIEHDGSKCSARMNELRAIIEWK